MTVFDISNGNITTLVGVVFPEGVTTLYCDGNQLTSLAGCPNSVTTLYCNNNQLTSLVGCPPSVTTLDCSGNQLTSLAGCPPSVTHLYCRNDRLTSLLGCPASVAKLYCSYNRLTSLAGCPLGVKELSCNNNPLDCEYANKSLEDIHALNWQLRYDVVRRNSAARTLQRAWRAWVGWWITPQLNQEGQWEAPCAVRSYDELIKSLLQERVSTTTAIQSSE